MAERCSNGDDVNSMIMRAAACSEEEVSAHGVKLMRVGWQRSTAPGRWAWCFARLRAPSQRAGDAGDGSDVLCLESTAADLKKDSVRFLCMVLLTSKSFSHGSKTIGVVSVHVPVGPACVLVCAVACRARRVVGTKRSSLRS